jgi:hypothetical protein
MKSNLLPAIAEFSDHDLLNRIERAAEDERHATVQLIALLMEFDSRKLHVGRRRVDPTTDRRHTGARHEPVAAGRHRTARA